MGLDRVGQTRYWRCARLRHRWVAARDANAHSRKVFSRFLSRRCHGDHDRARRPVRRARHDCVARRHRRHGAARAAGLRDGCACGRPRAVGRARRTSTRVGDAARELARVCLHSRAFASCVCADLHIRAMRNGIGPTNRADPGASTRAPSSLRWPAKTCTFGYVHNFVRAARCRARVCACEPARVAHAERRVRTSARRQNRVRARIARRKSARRVTNGA